MADELPKGRLTATRPLRPVASGCGNGRYAMAGKGMGVFERQYMDSVPFAVYDARLLSGYIADGASVSVVLERKVILWIYCRMLGFFSGAFTLIRRMYCVLLASRMVAVSSSSRPPLGLACGVSAKTGKQCGNQQ